MYNPMKRFMQCLFGLGTLLIVVGIILLFRPAPTLPPPPIIPTVSPIIPAKPPTPKPSQPKLKMRQKPKPIPKPKPILLPLELPGVPLPVAVEELKKEEFNADILNHLPKPKSVPSDVELPNVIMENDQWSGSQSGIVDPLQTVFRTSESWKAFWIKAITPYMPSMKAVPSVNFSKDMVVGVFMGKKPLSGYQVRIVSTAFEETNGVRTFTVRYKNMNRFLGIFAPRFDVQPFHLRTVPAVEGKVIFLEQKEVK